MKDDIISRQVFKGIVVEYPSYITYPEYKGKPYFLIKYTENGQEFIGYGTYKPEVLSEYLKEYFMPSAKGYTKADYIMALHKEYGCSLTRAEEAHNKALEYLQDEMMMKG